MQQTNAILCRKPQRQSIHQRFIILRHSSWYFFKFWLLVHSIYAWLYSMLLTESRLVFFRTSWQHLTDRESSHLLCQLKIYRNCTKRKQSEKNKIHVTKHWENLSKNSGKNKSQLTSLTTWFLLVPWVNILYDLFCFWKQ